MTFPVSISLPFDLIDPPEEFNTMAAVEEVARTAEAAGFYSCCVTDHPVPGSRWLDNGGHYAQDPFVMLSLVAAFTAKLRLQTNIIVLPYRNPFVTARAVSSLDVLSGGRFIFGMGAGYLKAEYKALGVDFDARNEIMDEYIRAMKAAWTGEDFTFEGTGYSAVGNRMRPAPVQQPHPPLLIGGNSRRAIRRAVELGDAWHPFFAPPQVTASARTVSLSDDAEIETALAYLRDHADKIGRMPKIILSSVFTVKPGWSSQEALDTIAAYRAKGVDGLGVSVYTHRRGEWCDLARQFGEDVLPLLD